MNVSRDDSVPKLDSSEVSDPREFDSLARKYKAEHPRRDQSVDAVLVPTQKRDDSYRRLAYRKPIVRLYDWWQDTDEWIRVLLSFVGMFCYGVVCGVVRVTEIVVGVILYLGGVPRNPQSDLVVERGGFTLSVLWGLVVATATPLWVTLYMVGILLVAGVTALGLEVREYLRYDPSA